MKAIFGLGPACRLAAAVVMILPGARAAAAAAEPRVVEGSLANGLRYAIIPSDEPDGRILVKLVVRGGDFEMLPRAQQVAHVTEHIVFEKLSDEDTKGTLWDRVARMGGVKGRDANAAAGPWQTSYFLRIPAKDDAALAEGLAIVRDWASPKELSDEEIDRGIKTVIEEGRKSGTRVSGTQREMWFGAGSPFGIRADAPGTLSATPAAVRAFHRRFFRPGNMAVIVVGDVDPARLIERLQAYLGPVPARGGPDPRPLPSAPSLRGGRIETIATAEAPEYSVQVTFKYRLAPAGSPLAARDLAVQQLAEKLFQGPSANLSRKYSAPVQGGGFAMTRQDNIASAAGLEIVSGDFVVRPRGLLGGVHDVVQIAETVRRTGFAPDDIERAKREALEAIGEAPASSAERADVWATRFVTGHAPPDRAAVRAALGALRPTDVNELLGHWLSPGHRDILLVGPKAATMADRSAIEDAVRAAEANPAAVLTAPSIGTPILPPLPEGKAEPHFERHGAISIARLPLSGATLLYRQKAGGRMAIVAIRRGGTARFEPEDRPAARLAPEIVVASGLGGLDRFALAGFLQNEAIEAQPFVRAKREGLRGAADIANFPTLLQLLRAFVREPQCHPAAFDEVVVDAAPLEGTPGHRQALIDAKIAELTGDDGPMPPPASDRAAVCDAYKQLIGDMRGMTIAAEGPLRAEEAFAAMARALDIPSSQSETKPAEMKVAAPRRSAGKRYALRIGSADLASVSLILQHPLPPGAPLADASPIASEILISRLYKRLRLREMGIYRLDGGAVRLADPDRIRVELSFDCRPDRADALAAAAEDELRALLAGGPTADEVRSASLLVAGREDTLDALAERWVSAQRVEPPPPADENAVARWFADVLGEGLDIVITKPAG